MRNGKIALLLASAFAALPLLAAGCGDDDPSVLITTPDDAQELDAGDVQVAIEVENFSIVDKIGDPLEDGEGHVHFYIDIDDVPTKQGEPAVTDEGTYHAEATNSYTWEAVEPGEHIFAVQLVNNDHTPLDPPVIDEVNVTVTGAGGDGDEDEPTRTPGRTSTPEESPEESPEETPEEETATPTPRTSPTTTP